MSRRVLIFSTAYFPLVGGAEVAVREITDRLPNWTFDLVCARIRPGLPAIEKIGNVTVHRVGCGTPFDKFLFPFWGAWKALWLSGPREVFVWSILASYAGYAAVVYAWFRPLSKIVLTLQEGDPFERYEQKAGVLDFTRRWIFRRAGAVQVISRFLGVWATGMGFRGEPVIIPNGVDLDRFTQRISIEERRTLRASFGFHEDDVILVTTGRLTLKNAVDDLIRALAFLPSTMKILSIGDGEDKEKLEALVAELGLAGRVALVPKQDHAEMGKTMQAADVFVRASLSEGLGNSFLEAMAASLPIIGTPVGGIPDFLIDGKTGVFCQPRDPASIAAAVKRIQGDPDLRAKLIENGKKLVQETYGWDRIARLMDDLFHHVSA